MPGLSEDPDAAQRQLEGLARGRQSQAQSLLEAMGWTVKPGRVPGHKPGQPAVHAYPDPDPDPEPQHAPRPPAEPREPGLLGRLGDGIRAGLDL